MPFFSRELVQLHSYPIGHYVRTLGKIGDKAVENEVLLIEHDVPHEPFNDDVLKCLPVRQEMRFEEE